VILVFALLAFGQNVLAIPGDFSFAAIPWPTLSGAVVDSAQVVDTHSRQLPRGAVSIRLLAEAPVFRPDDGRVPRDRVESGRFRPDSRDESLVSREKGDHGAERRPRSWHDRQDDRFRPLPEKRRRYEELYPSPAVFPPAGPQWRP
jgi:hypothetical protein